MLEGKWVQVKTGDLAGKIVMILAVNGSNALVADKNGEVSWIGLMSVRVPVEGSVRAEIEKAEEAVARGESIADFIKER